MQTLRSFKISDKVKKANKMGFSISALAKHLNMSRPTFYARLLDNAWTDSEINKLQSLGILK